MEEHELMEAHKELHKDLENEAYEGQQELDFDLYEVNNKPYFGEMTFTSAGGFNNFYTQDFLNELGGYCDLNIAPKLQPI